MATPRQEHQSWLAIHHVGCRYACPFYVYDPITHAGCLSYTLRRPPDVRQHIERCHVYMESTGQGPPYPTCQDILLNHQDWTSIPIHHECKLSIQEFETLRHLTRVRSVQQNQGAGEVQKWYAIWRAIFPGHADPLSPFANPNNVCDVVSRIRPSGRAAFATWLPELRSRLQSSSDLNSPAIANIVENILDGAYLVPPPHVSGPCCRLLPPWSFDFQSTTSNFNSPENSQ